MDISDTLAPKSDQLNAEDLLTSARTVTIEKVVRMSSDVIVVAVAVIGLSAVIVTLICS